MSGPPSAGSLRIYAGARRRVEAVLWVLGFGLGLVGLGVGLAYQAVRTYLRPPRTRPSRTPADLGLPYEAVWLRCADGVLAAAWYVAPRNGATIILVHGLGGNREHMLDRAARFAARGFGALLLDLRAHGESRGGNCSIGLREVAEVRAAVDYLRAHPSSRLARIGILGESLGGSVALLAAAEIPEIEAVAVDSSFCALDELVAERAEDFLRLPRWLRTVAIRLGEWQAGVRTHQVRPVDAAARLGARPLLVIHGGQDAMFPPQHAERLYAAASGPKELWLVPEATHAGICYARPEEYEERLALFFERWLRGRAEGPDARGQGAGVGGRSEPFPGPEA